ncbi:MAG: hypothetical protein AAGH92_10235 [Planctomycetota bacterium]
MKRMLTLSEDIAVGRKPADRRQAADDVVRSAQYLDPTDRRLIEQVYRYGQPVRGLAALMDKKPGVLRRRIDRLISRMESVEFRTVCECLPLFPEPYRAVAELRHLRGRSLANIAEETGLPFHQVRERLRAVQALIRVGRALMAASAVSKLNLTDFTEGPADVINDE